MNITRWLPRSRPLAVAALAITAVAAILIPAPASATAAAGLCTFRSGGPNNWSNPAQVSADLLINCSDVGSTAYASVHLYRDGTLVGSDDDFGIGGAWAYTAASCVPGNYVAYWYASVSDSTVPESYRWQSPSTSISCAPPPPAVANPGSRSTYIYDYAYLQMTATGGTAPYNWSASGLPTGTSINSSTGVIAGTVTQFGTYTVTVSATDAAGRTGSTQFTWLVRREACPTC